MDVDSVRFAGAARAVGSAARSLGLVVPGFVSPPRLAGVDRSLRRRPGAAPPAVAVRRSGRSLSVVVTDMVDGVVVANGLRGRRAEEVRAALLAAVELVRRDEAQGEAA
ncbi:MAG TPA: hypothetical protein VEA78_10025 [Acidimicrobiales bacterium]|nr:hypothetical protein [Acidimicrobiales bacterium]